MRVVVRILPVPARRTPSVLTPAPNAPMEYLVGVSLGLGVCLFLTLVGLDRDRALYPAISIVIASYYALFAVMGGSSEALRLEIIGIAAFVLLSVVGFRINLWFVVGALAAHGVFDWFHAQLIADPGVPQYWPGFCMTFDVVAAAWLAGILRSSRVATKPSRTPSSEQDFSQRIRPHVDTELLMARTCMASRDFAGTFRHLERAHVLGQRATREHLRVHWHMLRWAMSQGRMLEVAGQAYRLVGAALLTAIGLVPEGNTGGGNVSAFRRMPVPDELAQIIAAARDRHPL